MLGTLLGAWLRTPLGSAGSIDEGDTIGGFDGSDESTSLWPSLGPSLGTLLGTWPRTSLGATLGTSLDTADGIDEGELLGWLDECDEGTSLRRSLGPLLGTPLIPPLPHSL